MVTTFRPIYRLSEKLHFMLKSTYLLLYIQCFILDYVNLYWSDEIYISERIPI